MMTWLLRRSCRPVTAVVVFTATATVTGCDRNADRPTEEEVPQVASMDPLCDRSEFHGFASQQDLVARRLTEQQSDTALLAAAGSLQATEVHDCQQLIYMDAEDTLRYGVLAALLVDTLALRTEAGFSTGKVVGDIIAYGEAFDMLDIADGRNCVWLQGEPDATNWTASIWPRPAGQSCSDAQPDDPRRRPVTRLRYGTAAGDTIYPSTGRWMWDGRNRLQFIGMRCGNAWCEFGPTGFTPTAGIANSAAVPGWFDEQLMAFWDNNALRVSNVMGRISPGPGQGNAPVAVVRFSPGDSAVRQKYRDYYGIPGSSPNEIRGNIFAQQVDPSNVKDWHAAASLSQVTWVAVHRFEHQGTGPGHAGRGAVRWAWDPQDEKAWFPCDNGCCMTDAGIL